MTLDALVKASELASGIAVVLSLVYLAYQVRQNTESLRTENYARLLDRMSNIQSRFSLDPDVNRIIVVGAQSLTELTPMERVRFSWAMYELLGAAEFMFHQSTAAALPPNVRKRWEDTLFWWLSYPGIRVWWGAKPVSMSADFERFVDTGLKEHRLDTASEQRWQSFVAGDFRLNSDNRAPSA